MQKKLLADDTPLFVIGKDLNNNNDLSLISKWAFNWEMFFSLHSSKTVNDVWLLCPQLTSYGSTKGLSAPGGCYS